MFDCSEIVVDLRHKLILLLALWHCVGDLLEACPLASQHILLGEVLVVHLGIIPEENEVLLADDEERILGVAVVGHVREADELVGGNIMNFPSKNSVAMGLNAKIKA